MVNKPTIDELKRLRVKKWDQIDELSKMLLDMEGVARNLSRQLFAESEDLTKLIKRAEKLHGK